MRQRLRLLIGFSLSKLNAKLPIFLLSVLPTIVASCPTTILFCRAYLCLDLRMCPDPYTSLPYREAQYGRQQHPFFRGTRVLLLTPTLRCCYYAIVIALSSWWLSLRLVFSSVTITRIKEAGKSCTVYLL